MENKTICDLAVFVNVMCNKNFLKEKALNVFDKNMLQDILLYGELEKKQGIPFVFEILSYKRINNKKYKTIKLFNITIKKKESRNAI